MIMYKIIPWSTLSPIVPTEVLSQTKCYVTVSAGLNIKATIRERKEGNYFNTFDEAKKALIDDIQEDVKGIEKQLRQKMERLEELKALKEI